MKIRMLSLMLFTMLALELSCALADSAWMYPDHTDETDEHRFLATYLNDNQDIIALRRGDTLIVSMDTSVLQRMHYEAPRTASQKKIYTIVQAAQIAQSILIDSEYQRCQQEYAQTGKFDATAYALHSIGKHGKSDSKFDLNMDHRLVGSKWISVLRPAESTGTALSTCFSAHQATLRMQDGTMDVEITGYSSAYLYLDPILLDDLPPELQMRWGKLYMDIYPLNDQLNMPVYIAVLRDAEGGHRSLQDVALEIGYARCDSLSGYADGADAIYCCILDEREMQLLRDGTLFMLTH